MAGPFDSVQLNFVSSFAQAEQFWRWCSQRRPYLCVDLETAGLDPWAPDARVRLIQVGDADTGWAFPFHRWGGVVEEVLRHWPGDIVGHNWIGFDERYLMVTEPDWPLRKDRTQDTMLVARLMNPVGTAALKPMSIRKYGPQAGIGEQALKEGFRLNDWDWNTVPMEWETYSLYGAIDTVLGARLWEEQQTWLSSPINRSVYEMELDVRHIATAMEVKGFRTDREYVSNKHAELAEQSEIIHETVKQTYGISVSSPKQVTTWLLDHGVQINNYTRAGNPSADKNTLKSIVLEPDFEAETRMLASTVLEARKIDKIINSYLTNFVKFGANDGGLIHPTINTLAARTSRMSVRNPALQTLHHDDAVVRDSFVASDPATESVLTADYSQIELRLIAHFSGDQNMIQAFNVADATGGNFFVEVGKVLYDPAFMKEDKRYSLIKNTMYASGYGAGIPRMALTAGVPLMVMEPVASAIFDRYPGIKGLQHELINQVRDSYNSGAMYIETPLGRRLRVDPDKEYTGTNYKIQGHAAEILKLGMINCANSGLLNFMVLPVHDELVFSVPNEIVEDVKPLIMECMQVTREQGYGLPIPVEIEGPFARWGDKYRDKVDAPIDPSLHEIEAP